MFALNEVFTPTTAVPDGCGITEVLPALSLRQYVRCLWKCVSAPPQDLRIIPDCCADIIIPLDGSSPVFVGVSDASFITRHMGDVFGIRFYAWAVAPFVHINLDGMFNGSLSVDRLGGLNDLQLRLIAEPDFTKQAEIAQAYVSLLFDGGIDTDVMNGIYCAIKNDCRVSVKDIADYCAVSARTLERRFMQFVGVSPKTMIELLRFQLLWQEVIKCGFCAADGVFKFGYCDEPHLHHDFKRYHGLSLSAARAEYLKLSRFYKTFVRN